MHEADRSSSVSPLEAWAPPCACMSLGGGGGGELAPVGAPRACSEGIQEADFSGGRAEGPAPAPKAKNHPAKSEAERASASSYTAAASPIRRPIASKEASTWA